MNLQYYWLDIAERLKVKHLFIVTHPVLIVLSQKWIIFLGETSLEPSSSANRLNVVNGRVQREGEHLHAASVGHRGGLESLDRGCS